ncbi:LysE family translocator [Microbacterium esteraromaticum]|uniref:LysE family translocator n=1 Tax=Microbacterium esteraromaticum TaxID=57043 RepID=A0A7D8AA52_9MICO|nr:LysE family translocator [Microbacterium esteraromaticum]
MADIRQRCTGRSRIVACVSPDTFVALLLFLFPLAYSPGPGNAFFAGIGASRGLRAALPALTGYHAATFVVTAALGLGMGATLLNDPVVARTLAALGGVYVLWLAFAFLRSAVSGPKTGMSDAGPTRIGFWSGVVVLVLNPKAYYIIAVMFTQFLRPPANDDVATTLALTAVFTINNLVAFIVWVLGGSALAMLFRGERSTRWIDGLFAVTLVGVAIWMAVPIFAPS